MPAVDLGQTAQLDLETCFAHPALDRLADAGGHEVALGKWTG